jgi:hypothetical protein
MALSSSYTRSLPPNDFDLGTGCFSSVLTTPNVGNTPLDDGNDGAWKAKIQLVSPYETCGFLVSVLK